MQLHVWGTTVPLPISPESVACTWLLSIFVPHHVEFEIVTSNNTNLASCNLPLLVVGHRRIEGFAAIANYLSSEYDTDTTRFVPRSRLSADDQLSNGLLQSYLEKLDGINKYNLYVNSANYENFTRPHVSLLFPFPMKYNQPLRMHREACEQARLVGLNVEADEPVGELLDFIKRKPKELREKRYSLRCMGLFGEIIKLVMDLFKELNPELPVAFAHLFRPKKVSSSELLLYAYIHCICCEELKDQFLREYLKSEFGDFWRFAQTIIEALNAGLKPERIREPRGNEVPNLWNQVRFWALGQV